MARCGLLCLPMLNLALFLLLVLGDLTSTAVSARTLLDGNGNGVAEPPLPAEAPGGAVQISGGRHDRSIAGAEVILAGFAAAVMVVVVCYIRVTRKSNIDRARLALAGAAVKA